MRFVLFLGAASLGVVFTAATSGRTEPSWPPKPHVLLAGGHAVGGHQQKELSWGGAGLASAELGLTRGVGAQLELGYLRLRRGEVPKDRTLERLGNASALHGALGVRLAPLEWFSDPSESTGPGLWLAAAGGMARTGDLTRAMADAWLGYDFPLLDGRLALGPTAGWIHVFQPDSDPRPADANILLIGIHAALEPQRAGPTAEEDRDHDGILDKADACPDDPEDKDGFEDKDGCPDLDHDHDGIPDKADACPDDPEDKDGFEDEDGCPEDDNDKDGLADPVDKCPNEPEDIDNFEDSDGCPDPDNDKDGILDAKDLCPDEPETVNSYADDDGCPDEQQIRVVGDKILLDDRIHFPTNAAIILRDSHALMRRLAKLVQENPEYVHIEIQGYADPRGPASFNLKLSQARAESVQRFLIKEGVDPTRLSAVGLGEVRPVVTTEDELALYMERRVEFQVTRERKVKPGESEPSPSAEPQPDLLKGAAETPSEAPKSPATEVPGTPEPASVPNAKQEAP